MCPAAYDMPVQAREEESFNRAVIVFVIRPMPKTEHRVAARHTLQRVPLGGQQLNRKRSCWYARTRLMSREGRGGECRARLASEDNRRLSFLCGEEGRRMSSGPKGMLAMHPSFLNDLRPFRGSLYDCHPAHPGLCP